MPTRREEYDLKLAGLEEQVAFLANFASDMIRPFRGCAQEPGSARLAASH